MIVPLRLLAVFAAVLAVLLAPAGSSAHELSLEQLLLQPDAKAGELRGQLTLSPHHTRAHQTSTLPPNADLAARVLELAERRVRVELDGGACRPRYEIRELWVPGGATAGDLVLLRCPLPPSTQELRVHADASFHALVVTVQSRAGSDEITSHSALLRAASSSPRYYLGRENSDFRPGGPQQFEAPDPAPSSSAVGRVETSPGFERASSGAEMARYLVLGFVHILPEGWDHVLFVAGLVLGSALSFRRLLLQLSLFTVAHTATLAAGALGWLRPPGSVIEPLIAFSIAYVALENLRPETQRKGRPWVVFGFGLLHGLGFAGALSETGLSAERMVLSLLAFNCGVELGQLVVVAGVCCALLAIRRHEALQRFTPRLASLAIAATGLFWGVQRLFV